MPHPLIFSVRRSCWFFPIKQKYSSLAPFAKRSFGLPRNYATTFAHKKALPSSLCIQVIPHASMIIPWIHMMSELYNKKAGDGNRTHVSSLEGWCSTIELHPHVQYSVASSHRQIIYYHNYISMSTTFLFLMPSSGIEPETRGFSVLCSTNWANWAQNCGNRIWTYDLRVMSPASFQTAPSRDI